MTVVALVNDTPVPYTVDPELIGMLAFAAIVLVEVEKKYPPPVDIADDPVAPVKPVTRGTCWACYSCSPVAPVMPCSPWVPVCPVAPLLLPVAPVTPVTPCGPEFLVSLEAPVTPV